MIPLEKLRAVKTLYTHANCPDGVASALIVKDALPDVRVSFVKYGTLEHQNIVPEPGMLFCDFSPWLPKDGERYGAGEQLRERLIEAWREAGVIVLDHHSRDVVEPYGDLGVFGENERLECGAWLAYEHVWLPLIVNQEPTLIPETSHRNAVREFAYRAAVRDTWAKDHELWQQACEQAATLIFFPFEDIPPLRQAVADAGDIGRLLLKKQLAAAWRNARQPEVVAALRVAGHDVYDFRNPAPGDHGFGWEQVEPDQEALRDPRWFRHGVLTHPIAQEAFAKDMGALRDAEATVLVLPCGRSAHLELGWAAGAGKQTVVLLDDPMSEPELMYLMNTHVCVSLDEVLRVLDPREESRAPLGCRCPFGILRGDCPVHGGLVPP